MKKNKSVNDKETALIKLLIWGIFIAFVLLISRINVKPKTENPPTNSNVKEITYLDKLDKLNNNYKYNYLIRVNNEEYTFSGTIMEDEDGNTKEHGTKTINDVLIEYYFEKGHWYEVKDGLNPITDSELFQNINLDNINVLKIKELIKDKDYLKEEDKYVYNIDSYRIVISVNESDVEEIELFNNNDYYKLSFEMVGSIKKVEY